MLEFILFSLFVLSAGLCIDSGARRHRRDMVEARGDNGRIDTAS